MRAARSLAALGGLMLALVGTGCAYAPNPESGTLKCAQTAKHECPEGYVCDGQYCLKNGAPPSDGGKTTPCAGSCMIKLEGTLTKSTAGPVTGTGKFVGHWVFDAGSTETVNCTDGSTKNNDLATDYVDVALNVDTVVASYFCDWNLTVGPAGAAAGIRAGQSCSRDVSDATTGVTKFTWHGTTFTFTTIDGKMATLASMIGVEYVNDASKTGCTP